jgi:hypothetical protein
MYSQKGCSQWIYLLMSVCIYLFSCTYKSLSVQIVALGGNCARCMCCTENGSSLGIRASP